MDNKFDYTIYDTATDWHDDHLNSLKRGKVGKRSWSVAFELFKFTFSFLTTSVGKINKSSWLLSSNYCCYPFLPNSIASAKIDSLVKILFLPIPLISYLLIHDAFHASSSNCLNNGSSCLSIIFISIFFCLMFFLFALL